MLRYCISIMFHTSDVSQSISTCIQSVVIIFKYSIFAFRCNLIHYTYKTYYCNRYKWYFFTCFFAIIISLCYRKVSLNLNLFTRNVVLHYGFPVVVMKEVLNKLVVISYIIHIYIIYACLYYYSVVALVI